MKPRTRVLEAKDTDRYWCVDVRGEEHHFRFPSYALAGRLIEWSGASDRLSLQGKVLWSGALIGACWWNRGQALEASLPLRPTDDEIDAFATAVTDELQEAGYTLAEFGDLGRPCDVRVVGWYTGKAEAVEAAPGFTGEPEEVA